MLKLPERFVVDRATWLRGDNNGETCLLDKKGNRCCVGFLAKAAGLTDDDIRPASYLNEVRGVVETALPDGLRNHSGGIYRANDSDAYSTEAERERVLTEKFAAIGIEVRFEGEGNPATPAPIATWRARCGVCQLQSATLGRFKIDSVENPHPSGLFCPDCRARGMMAPGILHFVADDAAAKEQQL